MLLLSLAAACGAPDSSPPLSPGTGAPTVLSTVPANGATGVSLGGSVSATFNEAMNPATLTGATFTLTSGVMTAPVQGTVEYAGSTAVFWPGAPLAASTSYTATLTTAATSASGDHLPTDQVWRFYTTSGLAQEPGVSLGLAGGYAVLAQSGISTVPSSSITGNIGVSPAAASYITGFSLAADPSNQFSTSPQVTGKVYAADYAVPTPFDLTTAVVDLRLAFADAAGRAAGVTDLGSGRLDRLTLAPGVYHWTGDVVVTTVVTLSGSATDVWILQVAGNLGMGNGALVRLVGEARPANVFWQVAGLVDLGMLVQASGIFLSGSSITLGTDASVNGRLLAQTAATISQGTVVEPSP